MCSLPALVALYSVLVQTALCGDDPQKASQTCTLSYHILTDCSQLLVLGDIQACSIVYHVLF